jgi:hypothetical protein
MAGTLTLRNNSAGQAMLPDLMADTAVSGVSSWRTAVVILALPMFAQCFQYMVDVAPLYFLSKAWPFLMLPLFVYALVRLEVPFKLLQIVTLVWILGITPLAGIVQLGNGFGAAMATTVKVWPYTFSFALAGLLVLLRTPQATLRRVILSWGVATYVIMLALWVLIPTSAYGGGDVVTKLFMYDPERGYHLYMPMFFGMLLVFVLNRSFWIQPRLWKLLALAVCIALQFYIYKERTAVAGGLVAVAVGAALSMGRWRIPALAMLALAGGVGALHILGALQQTADLRALGGSLAVRQVTVATAWNYLSADPWRWLVGVGATTRFGGITLAQLFGNRMFFLTDIGWLGVVFEYGAIGACLMLLVHLVGLVAAARSSRPADALSLAFFDYVLYLIVVSAVYSVVFTPGELTTIIALTYVFARGQRYAPAYRALQPVNPMPRHIALASPRPSGRLSLRAPSGFANSG